MTKRTQAAASGANPLPPRLRRFIVTVALVGLVSQSIALIVASRQPFPPLSSILLTAAFFVVGDLALMNIRFGHNNYSFTWSELAVVFGLVTIPSAWLVVVATAAVAIAQAMLRRPAFKLVFNAMSTATGVGLARLVCLALGVSAPGGDILHSPSTVIVVAAATLSYTAWNSITVGIAVAFSQRLNVISVLRKGALLQAIVWLGNTVAGVGVAQVASTGAGSLIVLPFFLGLLYYAYFAYLRLAEDRDSWQGLQDTSADLARLARAEIAAVVLERADQLFRAEYVDLLLLDPGEGGRATSWTRSEDEPVVRRGIPLSEAGTYWPRAQSERELFELRRDDAPPVQRRELEELGLNTCLVLPLASVDECLGALRIGFRGPVRLRRREQQVLRTLGNQLAVSVQNARLFEQTREERAKLRRVVNNTSDGILSVDASGRITSWNPAMARMTALDERDVLGEAFTLGTDARDDAGRPITVEWLWGTLGSLGSVEAKVALGGPNREERWLALSVSAVRRPGGELDTLVLVARDVTALHKASRAKEEFLSTVSHELRTPLTSLNGWLVTLLRPDFNPEGQELDQIHEMLLRQSNRLQRLVEDLLNVNALEEGDITVDTVTVAVDDVVEKVLTEFSAEHAERAVRHERAGLAGLAVADPVRLEQVLVHLLSNAAKYSPAGTPVTVAVSRTADAVEIVVADQGYGIPADQLDAIFERFTRLGDYMTRAQQQGTGVGLHIARRLVDAMNGRIWATSRLGRGSELHVALPAAPLVARAASH